MVANWQFLVDLSCTFHGNSMNFPNEVFVFSFVLPSNFIALLKPKYVLEGFTFIDL